MILAGKEHAQAATVLTAPPLGVNVRKFVEVLASVRPPDHGHGGGGGPARGLFLHKADNDAANLGDLKVDTFIIWILIVIYIQ